MARELTGRHVLIITLAAFGVIIAVNVVMAFLAVGSFPGLEVQNSYVASQEFDRDRQAQQGLGWTAKASYDGSDLTIEILDKQGRHPILRDLTATVGRPTHKRADVTPDFTVAGGVYRAPLDLEPGAWNIHVQAVAEDGTRFRQRLDHYAGARVN
ncbi:nitrogen fixation protein FixH [Paracoccus sp. YIM 132242]|uniref:Nitrogen fixation protein FixH n=1 Tax=Paracoccus lichenicola TaxID=2665644 RepID=A0A6L6HMF5_9RHOB|nr:FixH family protein [Paracoccus lichenicola]MTD99429.1 nitrogen fixation protein FixH [Paracoccus lichenicola]